MNYVLKSCTRCKAELVSTDEEETCLCGGKLEVVEDEERQREMHMEERPEPDDYATNFGLW